MRGGSQLAGCADYYHNLKTLDSSGPMRKHKAAKWHKCRLAFLP